MKPPPAGWGFIGRTQKPQAGTLHQRRTFGHTLCGLQILRWRQPVGWYAGNVIAQSDTCRRCFRILQAEHRARA